SDVPWLLAGSREGEPAEIRARFVIDATGPAGVVARTLGLAHRPMRTNSWSVFTHFAGVARWEDVLREYGGRPEDHPYHCDDAALHHVIDAGWMWVLRFDNGVTSAGFLFDGEHHPPDTQTPAEQLWLRTIVHYPGIARQF